MNKYEKLIKSVLKRDILVQVSNFLLNLLLANKLGPSLYGIWLILILIPGYGESFGRLKTDVGSVYFLRKKLFPSVQVFGLSNLINFVISILTSVLIFIFLDTILDFYGIGIENYRNICLCLIFSIPFIFLNASQSYYYLGTEKINIYNFCLILQSVSFLFFLTVIVYVEKIDLYNISFAFLFSHLLVSIYNFTYIMKNSLFKNIFSFDVDVFKKLLNFSFPLYISGIFSFVIESIYRTFGVIFVNSVVIANIYSAMYLSKIVNKFSDPFLALLYAELSSLDHEDSAFMALRSLKLVSFFSFTIVLITYLFADVFVNSFYDEKYTLLLSYLYLSLPIGFFLSLNNIFYNYFNSVGKSKLNLKISAASFVCQIALFFLFGFFLNDIGIILSVVLTHLLTFYLYYFIFKNTNHLKLYDFIISKNELMIIYNFITISLRKKNV